MSVAALISTTRAAPSEVAFIDPGIPDLANFLAGLRPRVRPIVLSPDQSAPRQIAGELRNHSGLAAVHVVAHGAPGEIGFSSGPLSQDTVDGHAKDLACIGRALAADGSVFLWSCNTAEGEPGSALLQRLSAAAGARIAGASGRVGSSRHGARWELAGAAGPTPPLTAEGVAAYAGVLANQAPVVDTHGGSLAYTENHSPQAIDTTLTLSDVDSTMLVGATVKISGNFVAGQDVLAFNANHGISGSYNAATGILTLSGTASVAQYQIALRSVTYFNSSDNPSAKTRTIHVQVDDGAAVHNLSNVATSTVTVTPVNDAPVVDMHGGSLAYTENHSPQAIDKALTLSDLDSKTLAGATVKISGNFAAGQDVLAFTAGHGISGSYNAATGILTLSGAASVAQYQAALRSVTYFNSSDNPSAKTRTIHVQVDDGAAVHNLSNVATSTVTVTPVNDAPVVDMHGGSLAYTENHSPQAIDTALTLADVDSVTLAGAIVTISANFVAGEDVLAFAAGHGITGSYDAATGVLTLSGTASVAQYQAALRTVTYFNSSDNPSALTRTIHLQVDDGAAVHDLSNVAASTVTVKPVNDAPVVNTHGGSLAYTENHSPQAIDTALTLSDVDSPTLAGATVTISGNFAAGEDVLGFINQNGISGSYSASTGILALSGTASVADYQAALQSVTYSDTSDDPSALTRTIHFRVDDGAAANHASVIATSTLTVTPVNDAPVVDAGGGSLAYTENDPATAIDSALTVADVDSPTLAGATVTISGNFAVGQDGLGFADQNGISGSYDATTGVLTLSGTASVADYQAALQSVTYADTSDDPSSATRTISYQVDDGSDANSGSNTVTTSVTVTPVNDAPWVEAPTVAYQATEQTNLALSGTGLNVGDIDGDAGAQTATLAVGEGTLTVDAGGNSVAVGGNGTSSVTLQGTVGAIEALLFGNNSGAITYNDNTDTPSATTTLTLTIDDNGSTGSGGDKSVAATATIDIAAVDDPPVAVDDGGAATEAGGTSNGTAGANATGNVLANDTDPDDAVPTLAVSALRTGTEAAGTGTAGTVGTALTGAHGTLTLNANGSYSYAVNDSDAAVQGLNAGETLSDSFTYTVRDPGGLTDTAQLTITVHGADDTPVITGFADDTGVVGDGITKDATLHLTGTADANVTVEVLDGTTSLGTVSSDSSGNWSLDTAAFGDGLHSLTATETDGLGHTGDPSAALAVTIDTTPPAAPAITGFADDTGTAGDGITRDTTLHLTGTAEADATIAVFDGASPIGTVTADDLGAWSLDTAALPDGTHAFTATATDAAGNVSDASTALDVTVDTRPETPSQPDLEAASDSGPSNTDNVTNAGALTFTGTAADASSVEIFRSATSGGPYTILGTAPVDGDGDWSYTDSSAGNGSYYYAAKAENASGFSGLSPELFVRINRAAPPEPSIQGYSADTGVQGDGVTSDTDLQLGGTVSAVAGDTSYLIEVFDGATSLGTIVSVSTAWTFDTGPLSEGAHSFTAITTNQAGTVSASSAPLTVTIDTTAPAKPAITGFADDTGVAGDNATRDTTLHLTGTAEANAAIAVFAGATALGTATADGSGNWSFDTATLANGAHPFTATATDAAGNISATSTTFTVTIDPAAEDPPVGVDDGGTATEAGGTGNGTAGANATGNVLTNDTDPDDAVATLAVSALRTGTEAAGTGTAGTVGTALAGAHGTLTLNANGSYSYAVNDGDAAVQGLNAGQTLSDTFTYTVRDPGGLTDTAQLTITINGADDVPVGVDDGGTATEAGGTGNGTAGANATGNVLTNDTDPDDAVATLAVSGLRTGTEAAGTGTAGTVGTALAGAHGTLTLNANGSYSYAVNDSDAAVQGLNAGQTLTDTFTYTVRDPGGLTDTAQLTITINGADDAPVVNTKATGVVQASYQSGGFDLLSGDGQGDLGVAAYFAGPNYTATTIALGDFNGDGIQDVVTGNDYDYSSYYWNGYYYVYYYTNYSYASIWLGNSNGTFTPWSSFDIGQNSDSNAMAVGDVNGDHKLDVVTVSTQSGLGSVLLGNGTGGLLSEIYFATGGYSPIAVALADVNDDGKLDIIVANNGSGNIGVLLGNGSGGLATAVTYGSGGSSPSAVAVGDVNGDGKLDIVVTNSGDNNIGVLSGNGSGGFAAAVTYGSGGSVPLAVAVGDVNGDGKLDIVVANAGNSNVGVLLGNGSGGFASAATYAAGSGFSVALADMNGDGKLDIVEGEGNSVLVLLNSGGGSFGTASQYGGPGSGAIAVGYLGDVQTYIEQGNAVAVDPMLTLGDVDSGALAGATVTISGGFVAGDQLSFTSQNGISGSYDSGTHVLTLSGTASLAAYQAALRAVAFSSSSDNPTNFGAYPTRTISLTVNDGSLTSATATAAINVTAVDDAPVVTAGNSTNYVLAGAPTAISPAATVTDADSANFLSGTLTAQITANGTSTDQLVIRSQGSGAGQIGFAAGSVTYGGTAIGSVSSNVTGSTATIVIGLGSSATPTAVQALLDSIAFISATTGSARTVTYSLMSSGGPTGSATAAVNVVGPTGTLTTGSDTVTYASGTNVLNGIIGTGATLTSGDKLTGGTGTDSLDLTGDSATINLNAGQSVNTFTGFEVISLDGQGDTLTLPNSQSLAINVADLGGAGDTIALGTGAVTDTISLASGAETVNLTSAQLPNQTILGGLGGGTIAVTDAGSTIADSAFAHLAGIGTLKLTGTSTVTLGADAQLDGLTAVTTGSGATSIASASSYGISVDATALAQNTALTLAGTEYFSVSNLVGDISAGAVTGSLDVTTSDAADNGISIITGSGHTSISASGVSDTVSVNATALADNQYLYLSGSAAEIVTGLVGTLEADGSTGALTVTTGDAADNAIQVYASWAATSITANGAGDVVNVYASTLGTGTLTLNGSAAETVSALFGTIAAGSLTGALTVTTGSDQVGSPVISITTGSATTSVTTYYSNTVSINATALADNTALTLAGSGVGVTVTGLKGDVAAGGMSGALNITTVAVSGLTIATGSGSNTITASALTAGEVLTLTGSTAATVTLNAGNLSAGTYTGAITVTGGAGANTITVGNAANTITGGGGADILTGGTGADTFDFASEANLAAAATVAGGSGSDAIQMTAAVTLVDSDFLHSTAIETLALTGASTVTLSTDAAAAGIAAVTTGAGATSLTTTASGPTALAINAAALANGTVLTLAGPGTDTVTGLIGDIAAGSLTGRLTVTTGDASDNTISITSGAAATSITDSYAGDTVSANATALADDTALTLSGAAGFTLTGLKGDVAAGGVSGALNVTTVAVSGLTIATGSGSNTITASALTAGEVLTLTGSTAASVTLNAGNLSAGTYTGAIAVTGGASVNTITVGSGGSTITGGGAADTLTGGAGADTFTFTAATDSTTSAHDTINSFTHGQDLISFTNISGINATPGSVQGLISGATNVNAHSIAWVESSGNTLVYANTTASAEAQGSSQMEIVLAGVSLGLTSADFFHV